MTALLALFLSAFVAATLFPAGSEVVLAALRAGGEHDATLLVIVATVGNVLGALVNWMLGRYLLHFQDRRWFPFKPATVARASRWYQHWGVWTLLLAWLPIVGDPLTFVAGLLRTNMWLFLGLVTIGKAGRYVAVVAFL